MPDGNLASCGRLQDIHCHCGIRHDKQSPKPLQPEMSDIGNVVFRFAFKSKYLSASENQIGNDHQSLDDIAGVKLPLVGRTGFEQRRTSPSQDGKVPGKAHGGRDEVNRMLSLKFEVRSNERHDVEINRRNCKQLKRKG